MAAQFELKPVKDALIPQYPGISYMPPDEDESQAPRIRRAPAFISVVCIFLLSFGMMLSAAACNKEDDGSGSGDGDTENTDGDSEDAPCTSADNACVDESSARICIDGKLEEMDCAEYCDKYFERYNNYFSDGCNIHEPDNICTCYTQTAGDGDYYSDYTVCIDNEILEVCEYEICEEITCADFCEEQGKISDGCVMAEDRSSAYCDCRECSDTDNFCLDEATAKICTDGKLEEVNCQEYCEENSDMYGGNAYSEGCNAENSENICNCYNGTMGEYIECNPEDAYCADENSLMNCDNYYWQEIDCVAWCADQGLELAACVVPEDGAYAYCDCIESGDGDEEAEE